MYCKYARSRPCRMGLPPGGGVRVQLVHLYHGSARRSGALSYALSIMERMRRGEGDVGGSRRDGLTLGTCGRPCWVRRGAGRPRAAYRQPKKDVTNSNPRQ